MVRESPPTGAPAFFYAFVIIFGRFVLFNMTIFNYFCNIS